MRYKTIMLDINSYAKLASAKEVMRKKSGLKLSFEDLILDLIGRKLDLSPIDDRLKGYIERVTVAISEIEGVEGILLFGSVVKGTNNEYSDIDIAVVARRDKWQTFKKVSEAMKALKKERLKLMSLDLPSRISPVILDQEDLKAFNPFYFDLADYGIILYERGNSLSDFMNSMRWKAHKREIVNGIEVITW
jgi:predicted nucleotidyltransferase